jgi:hypothetical protein
MSQEEQAKSLDTALEIKYLWKQGELKTLLQYSGCHDLPWLPIRSALVLPEPVNEANKIRNQG